MTTEDFSRLPCDCCKSVGIERPAHDRIFADLCLCEPCCEAYNRVFVGFAAGRLTWDGRDELLKEIRRNLP